MIGPFILPQRLVKNLIDRKSAIYSSRPPTYIAHDLITQDDHFLMMLYGETFKPFSHILHQYFAETVCEKDYIELQHAEAAQMIRDFYVEPYQHMEHPKRFSNSIIMSIGKEMLVISHQQSKRQKLLPIMCVSSSLWPQKPNLRYATSQRLLCADGTMDKNPRGRCSTARRTCSNLPTQP